jgi:hypothetical protein
LVGNLLIWLAKLQSVLPPAIGVRLAAYIHSLAVERGKELQA